MESSLKRPFIKMGQQFSSKNTEIKSWFSALVGVDEEEIAALSNEERTKRFFRVDEKNNVRLMRCGPGKPHAGDVCCGQLKMWTIEELANAAKIRKGQKSSLSFVTRKDADVGSLQAVDVAHLQAQPENAGAMFQVASNMNGVEGISQETSVEGSTFVTDYIFDKTQGPCASISCGGAAVARVYGAFMDGKVLARQTKSRQLNFVENLSDFCTVENGYVLLKKLSQQEFDEKFDGREDELLNGVQVGVHTDCQVTFGRRAQFYFEGVQNSEKQLVHQTFGAAVNLAQGVSGIENRNIGWSKEFAHFVLQAMYRGCYLAALTTGCSKVFLTLLGGGVFGNDTRSLIRVITETHLMFGGGLDVQVIMYSPTPLSDDLKDFINECMGENSWSFTCYTKGVAEILYKK